MPARAGPLRAAVPAAVRPESAAAKLCINGLACVYICRVSVSAQTKAFEAAGELLKVLAAPARLAIVMELADQPRFVHELVERLGMSQPLVSSHLRVLRGARLVGGGAARPGAAYSLADQHVAHIVADAVQHSKEEP